MEVAFNSIDFQDGSSGWVHTLISNIVKPRHWEIVDIT